MKSIEFQCPSCSARLRLRDRNQLQRRIPCPDCSQPLKLSPDGPNHVVATRIVDDEAEASKAPVAATGRPTNGLAPIRSRLSDPRVASLLVATLAIMALAVFLLGPGETTADSSGDAVARDDGQPDAKLKSSPESNVVDQKSDSDIDSKSTGLEEVVDPKSQTAQRIASSDPSKNGTSKAAVTELPGEEKNDASDKSGNPTEPDKKPIVDQAPVQPETKTTDAKAGQNRN